MVTGLGDLAAAMTERTQTIASTFRFLTILIASHREETPERDGRRAGESFFS
jgi:hypothetical protein